VTVYDPSHFLLDLALGSSLYPSHTASLVLRLQVICPGARDSTACHKLVLLFESLGLLHLFDLSHLREHLLELLLALLLLELLLDCEIVLLVLLACYNRMGREYGSAAFRQISMPC
jgi:hypothetical protein